MTTPQVPGVPDHAAPSAPIESKVKWAAIGSYLAGVVVLALMNALTGDDNQLLVAALPDVVEPFLLPFVPSAVALISGYFARHTPRPDLGA